MKSVGQKQLSILTKLYNEDRYHIEFVDRVAEYIPKELLDLYFKVLELSLEAPFDVELNESYQVTIELLCKALGFNFDINGKIDSKEVN